MSRRQDTARVGTRQPAQLLSGRGAPAMSPSPGTPDSHLSAAPHLLPALSPHRSGREPPGDPPPAPPTDRALPGRPVPSQVAAPPAPAAPQGVSARARGRRRREGERSPRSYKSFPGEERACVLWASSHVAEEARGQAAQHRLGRGARPRGPLSGEEGSAHRALPQRLRPAG